MTRSLVRSQVRPPEKNETSLYNIYGPPGIGKFTVAKELAKITGYGLLHNHLTADLARLIFPFGTREYSQLVEKLRLNLFDVAAAGHLKGLIFTFVYGVETYGGRADEAFIQKIIEVVEGHGGEVLFVQLTCDTRELHKRLKNPSRKQFKKLRSVERLRAIRKEYDIDATIPHRPSLTINNTNLAAKEVAGMIMRHHRL